MDDHEGKKIHVNHQMLLIKWSKFFLTSHPNIYFHLNSFLDSIRKQEYELLDIPLVYDPNYHQLDWIFIFKFTLVSIIKLA